jgi:hypothetical protein
MSESRCPCPCCGYRTYVLPAGSTGMVCSVCLWEDKVAQEEPALVTITQAQTNFLQFGACERRYRHAARPPLPEELRSSDWLSYEDLRARTISLIKDAFAQLGPNGGVTLHQMRVLDDYGDEVSLREAAAKDPEATWEEITAPKLARFSGSLIFLNGDGLHFYLPAFMCHALTSFNPATGSLDADGVLFQLSLGRGFLFCGDSPLFSPAEDQAIGAFLFFVVCCGQSFDRDSAEAALKLGWQPHVPEFALLALM